MRRLLEGLQHHLMDPELFKVCGGTQRARPIGCAARNGVGGCVSSATSPRSGSGSAGASMRSEKAFRRAMIPRFLGREAIVDDGMPVEAGTLGNKYTTFRT